MNWNRSPQDRYDESRAIQREIFRENARYIVQGSDDGAVWTDLQDTSEESRAYALVRNYSRVWTLVRFIIVYV